MRFKGISDQGFCRLAKVIRSQAWGGDEIVATARKDFATSQAGTVGIVYEYSDGSKYYMDILTNGERLTTPDGTVLEAPLDYTNDPVMSNYITQITQAQYTLDAAPISILSEQEQEDFNAVMGTSYEVETLQDPESYTQMIEDSLTQQQSTGF